MEVEVHGGASRYSELSFGAIGFEASMRTVGGLRPVAGADVWLARRILPPNLALDRGVYDLWEAIVPVHVGAVVRFGRGAVRGQFGADLVVADYARDAPVAIGGRARAGLSAPVTEHLAVVVDLAAGAWSGDRWSEVAAGARDVGPLVQLSAGVAFGR